MEEKVLAGQCICKDFVTVAGKKTEVLKGISLEIMKGEFVSIMGQSGSGKSTLLYSISGMDHITSGTVKFLGTDISHSSDEEMSRYRLLNMGFIFQNACLLKNFTIEENIMLPAMKAGKESVKTIKERAKKLMELVGIEQIASNEINQVSGGQLQRAAICRALINKPDILFCDEPTGALNSSSTREVMEIIKEINQNGTSVVLVTHDGKVASQADRIIYISDGMIRDEFVLGKCFKDEGGLERREKEVRQWLEKNRF